jgi:gliding motility-associated lipoprotein GldH
MKPGQKTIHLAYILLFFIGLSMAACNDQYVFKAEKPVGTDGWSYTDTLDFKVPVTDTTQLYNLYISFTHADTFPNQNIYVKLYTRFPDGKRVSRLRSFDLFDVQGKPVGHCAGNKCETKILLQDKLYFNQIGEHLITLEQYARTNPLTGIQSLGILLEKTATKR